MKKQKLWLVGLFLLIFLVLPQRIQAQQDWWQGFYGGVSTSLEKFYLRFFPGNKRPHAILKYMLQKMAEVHSAKIDFETDLKLFSQANKLLDFQLSLSGVSDFGNFYQLNLKQQDFNLYSHYQLADLQGEINTDIKYDGQDFYVRPNNLSNFADFDFTDINGEWLLVENFSPNNELGVLNKNNDFAMNLVDVINRLDWHKASKHKIDGVTYYVLQADLNEATMTGIFDHFKLYDQIVFLNAKNYQRFLASFKDVKLKLLIDAKEFYLNTIQFSFVINLQEPLDMKQYLQIFDLDLENLSQFQDIESLQANWVLSLNDFNQNLVLQKPIKYQSSREVYLKILNKAGLVLSASDEAEVKGFSPELPSLSPQQEALLKKHQQDDQNLATDSADLL